VTKQDPFNVSTERHERKPAGKSAGEELPREVAVCTPCDSFAVLPDSAYLRTRRESGTPHREARHSKGRLGIQGKERLPEFYATGAANRSGDGM